MRKSYDGRVQRRREFSEVDGGCGGIGGGGGDGGEGGGLWVFW